MKNFKFIELPKEEVLSEVELSFIEGAESCSVYTICGFTGKNNCETYNSGESPCNNTGGCSPSLFCGNYSF